MNTYVFNEIKVGMSAAFNVVVTEEMQDNFLKLSGDNNPMHVDCEYATLSGFKDRVVYGMLTSAFYSRLAGVYLPGRNCLLQECKISFNKPVYIGDKLKVYGEEEEYEGELGFDIAKAIEGFKYLIFIIEDNRMFWDSDTYIDEIKEEHKDSQWYDSVAEFLKSFSN